MILSHKHRFIFIKTHKTAGTSIEVHLSAHCGPADVVTPIHPPAPGHQPRNHRGWFNPGPELLIHRSWQDVARSIKHFLLAERFYNHMPAWLVQRRVSPEVWQGYFKFCVERNPWDKTLSYYHMARHRSGGRLSLDQYLHQGPLPVEHTMYTDRAGRLLVDRVLRYERLDEELAEVFQMLDVPFSGQLGVRAKGDYRADRRSYREIFTPDQRDLVARAFAKEIEMFGYAF